MTLDNEVFKNWYEDEYGYCDSKHVEVLSDPDPKRTDRRRVGLHGKDLSGVDLQFDFVGDGTATPRCEVSGRWRDDRGPREGEIKPVRGLVTVNTHDILVKSPLLVRFAVLVEVSEGRRAFLQGAFSVEK